MIIDNRTHVYQITEIQTGYFYLGTYQDEQNLGGALGVTYFTDSCLEHRFKQDPSKFDVKVTGNYRSDLQGRMEKNKALRRVFCDPLNLNFELDLYFSPGWELFKPLGSFAARSELLKEAGLPDQPRPPPVSNPIKMSQDDIRKKRAKLKKKIEREVGLAWDPEWVPKKQRRKKKAQLQVDAQQKLDRLRELRPSKPRNPSSVAKPRPQVTRPIPRTTPIALHVDKKPSKELEESNAPYIRVPDGTAAGKLVQLTPQMLKELEFKNTHSAKKKKS